jgi:hypothetical protein
VAMRWAALLLAVACNPPAWAKPCRCGCAALLQRERGKGLGFAANRSGDWFCLGDNLGGPSIKMNDQGSIAAAGAGWATYGPGGRDTQAVSAAWPSVAGSRA